MISVVLPQVCKKKATDVKINQAPHCTKAKKIFICSINEYGTNKKNTTRHYLHMPFSLLCSDIRTKHKEKISHALGLQH